VTRSAKCTQLFTTHFFMTAKVKKNTALDKNGLVRPAKYTQLFIAHFFMTAKVKKNTALNKYVTGDPKCFFISLAKEK